MQENDPGQVAKLFGDPQTDIGCTCHQHGIGMSFAQRCEAFRRSRDGEKPLVVADEDVARLGKGGELRRGLARPRDIAVGRLAPAGIQRGIDDRAIAGAPAQVAGKPVIDRSPVRRAGLVVEGEQRHDESRRAEAALRSMAAHHRLLNRVQPALQLREVVHDDHILAVDLA